MIHEGSIRLRFNYAAGRMGSRFFAALGEKKILGARCAHCDRVVCPPRSFCPNCAEADMALVEVGIVGSVLSWTERPGESVFGLVKLDGADTPFLHRLLSPASRISVGARVRVRFAAECTAGILDIEGFDLVEESRP